MSPLRRQPITIEHALLGFLRRHALHGYELHQQLSDPDGLGLVWQVKQSHLYALLAKLEQAGYIAGSTQTQDHRPPRRNFQLTESGRRAFQSWVTSPVPSGRQFRLEFLVKLYFAEREGPDTATHLIDQQRVQCAEWRASLEARAALAQAPARYEWLVWQFRLGQVDAMLAWLDQCVRTQATASPPA